MSESNLHDGAKDLAEYPENLILEPSESTEGRFERLEEGHTRAGERRGIAILTVEGSERSLWLHEKALRGQFRQLRPEPGERVLIVKGAAKKTSEATGNGYWPFRVTAPDRPAPELDWSDPMLDAGDEPTPRGDAAAPDTSGLAAPLEVVARDAESEAARESERNELDAAAGDDIPF